MRPFNGWSERVVSIHAPARGATGKSAQSNSLYSCFNPRPRTGSDLHRHHRRTKRRVFQSTPPHGERLKGKIDEVEDGIVSIHAPARGATIVVAQGDITLLFQSTPPHGERLKGKIDEVEDGIVSIHAPARGATIVVAQGDITLLFQSTPPHGERHTQAELGPTL